MVVREMRSGPHTYIFYSRPTFRAVHKVDAELAIKYFESNKQFFHPIATKLISKVSHIIEPCRRRSIDQRVTGSRSYQVNLPS